jgi:nucleoside-diphosphate-sugar epimerase
MPKTILIFGNGYVSKFLSKELSELGYFVYCTSRNSESEKNTAQRNVKIVNFSDPALPALLKVANVILSTVPTDNEVIDPVLDKYVAILAQENPEWVGYLSSTGVYGDHNGNWVNEQTQCQASNPKSKIRLLAEQQWLELYLQYKIPVHILRLSGIYGPGRNCLEEINQGKDFTIFKKDQYFSRIHIFDLCQAIIASIHSPTPGEIYNISDDEPAPLHVVQQFGASILNKKPLIELLPEDAQVSKQFQMFLNDNKKISNHKIVEKLHIKWKYPNYRIGLKEGCLPYCSG